MNARELCLIYDACGGIVSGSLYEGESKWVRRLMYVHKVCDVSIIFLLRPKFKMKKQMTLGYQRE